MNINKIKFKFSDDIKKGYYSSNYFLTTQKLLQEKNINQKSTLRFMHFSNNVVLAGINESIQLIKFLLPKSIFEQIQIYYLEDGTITNSFEPVLLIEGDYKHFCFLENIIDGILSRRSSIATNCKNIVDIVSSNNIIFMSDRTDDYSLFPFDGYAAYIGGIRKFVTQKHVEFLNDFDVEVIGTIPHALIQQYKGDLVKTLIDYNSIFPDKKIVGLIDFNNDCLGEISKLHKKNIKLDFVRIDTSKKVIDKSLQKKFELTKDNSLFGVNHELISMIRNKLDKNNYKQTKIIATSSLNLETIKTFINKKTPIDIYGVGKSFLDISVNFTADLIKVNDEYLAKFGRGQNIDHLIKKMKKIH